MGILCGAGRRVAIASRTPRCSRPSCCATTSAGAAIGVYAAGAEAGDRASASFENAITAVEPPAADELAGRTTRRLLFYARPEPHAARNMFELGLLALGRALEQGAFGRGWELHGIGTVERRRRIDLAAGATLSCSPAPIRAATRSCCASTTSGWR